jgi:hypothetical protein
MNTFSHRIAPAVHAELVAAADCQAVGDTQQAFRHLERAHVLGQSSTVHHVHAHWQMLRWAWWQRDAREGLGQVMRLIGAATKTALGWVPSGNTGGANVSPFKPMPIPAELQAMIEAAKRP